MIVNLVAIHLKGIVKLSRPPKGLPIVTMGPELIIINPSLASIIY